MRKFDTCGNTGMRKSAHAEIRACGNTHMRKLAHAEIRTCASRHMRKSAHAACSHTCCTLHRVRMQRAGTNASASFSVSILSFLLSTTRRVQPAGEHPADARQAGGEGNEEEEEEEENGKHAGGVGGRKVDGGGTTALSRRGAEKSKAIEEARRKASSLGRIRSSHLNPKAKSSSYNLKPERDAETHGIKPTPTRHQA